MYCLLALLSYLYLITHSTPIVQLLSVDILLRCLYAQNMRCYQLVLLTMAKANPTPAPNSGVA